MVDANGQPCEGDDGYFQITKGGLREVSVVMYPNNPKAEIQQLEAVDAEGQINPRVLEKVLREAGLNRKDATTASSIVKKLWSKRDAAKPIDETPSQRDAGAVDELLAALQLRELTKELNKRINI